MDDQEQKTVSASSSASTKSLSGLISRRHLLKGITFGGAGVALGAGGTLAGCQPFDPDQQGSIRGTLREYWIQADSFFHNLVPNGHDTMMDMHYTPQQTSYWAIGYRAYTPNWGSLLAGNDDIGSNTGIPGPILRAQVGDTVRIHFRNNDTHYHAPHSMHTHGFHYTSSNDGAWHGTANTPGTAINVGETYTYEWTTAANSVGTWLYHDHSKPTNGIMEFGAQLGLFGMVAIIDSSVPSVDKELYLFFHDLYQSNIPSLAQDFDCFNGASFLGNTPTFKVKVGQRVRWRVAALGKEFHIFHLHGHRWTFNGRNDDALVFGPATTLTFDYVEDAPGTWLYHCHVTDHMMGGMVGFYVAS